jgi:hypothetical protein
MRKAVMGLILGSLAFSNLQAATWYGFTEARSQHAIFFFDLDTAVKQSGTVTLWVKTVNSEKWIDSDGAYAIANKDIYACTKRTVQSLIRVRYGKNQEHMRTDSDPGKAAEIIPGSVAETIWKIVCAPDFPNLKSKEYVRVGGNDIFAAAKRIMDEEDDPAPK